MSNTGTEVGDCVVTIPVRSNTSVNTSTPNNFIYGSPVAIIDPLLVVTIKALPPYVADILKCVLSITELTKYVVPNSISPNTELLNTIGILT